MQKKFNVLVFPGGTEIGLEIFKSLIFCKDIKLFSAGQNISNHAPFVFLNHFILPSVHAAGCCEALNHIITNNNINYIFPAHDDVIVALAQNSSVVKAKIIGSPLNTCLLTRSKSKTYELFKCVLPTPRLYTNIKEIQDYPVFVKPDKGQGSQDTHKVNNSNQLFELLKQNNEYIILEYLPGEEFTVDCFSDREDGLIFCEARQRVRVRNGISMNSCLVKEDQEIFYHYAQTINQKLDLYGAWFFQVKKDIQGIYKLLEIAPRIPGTMAIQRVRGVNLPLLSIYEHERIPIKISTNNLEIEIDRALFNRYKHNLIYSEVYVDLDDTLICNYHINTSLIKFLYQCVNRNIPLFLITKHEQDLEQTLTTYRIKNLFDKIIHLPKNANKADYIVGENPIFIDDSFSERQAVQQKTGKMTFDCSMIEMLIEEKG